jgi:hypothetical protein
MFNPKNLFEKFTTLAWPIGEKIRERINALLAAANPPPKAPLRETFSKANYSFKTLQADLRPIGNKKVLLRLLLTKLFKDPQFEKLVLKAFEGKSFKVEFVPKGTLYSEGECNFATKSIKIATDQSLSVILSTLIFELCNASNQTLSKISLNQFSCADDYALAMERAEYVTYKQHIELMQSLLQNKDFISTLEGVGENVNTFNDEVRDAFKNFAEYWQGANIKQNGTDYSHCEYYRRHYNDFTTLNGHFQKQPILVPGYISKHSGTSVLASQFHSKDAKELFLAITMNANALAILEQYQLPIAACLAKCTNPTNLQNFKALNTAEQVLFMTSFAKRNHQMIEAPLKQNTYRY